MPKAGSKAGGMARQDAVSEVEFEAEVVLKIEGSRRMQIGEKGVRKVEKKRKTHKQQGKRRKRAGSLQSILVLLANSIQIL